MTDAHDEMVARIKRRDRRFDCRAENIVEGAKRELSAKIASVRDEERQARKRHHDEDAEKYRKAGNALENALAELEEVAGELDE